MASRIPWRDALTVPLNRAFGGFGARVTRPIVGSRSSHAATGGRNGGTRAGTGENHEEIRALLGTPKERARRHEARIP